MNYFDDEYYMRKAIALAEMAAEEGEVPVGAVAVKEGKIIAKAWNQTEKLKDATAHAEILAITQAEIAVGDWRLDGVTLYVTKEPCAMCAGAMVNSRISRLVFGMSDPKYGCAGSVLNLSNMPGFLHKFKVTGGILSNESEKIMKMFFKNLRKKQKKESP
ncbi:MAG TPA: tRNA adenosine(34) deaminase TadA [Victivallales bacterium]|nr:tRNA adenosine(34) deaminase TadA [Victivallales bacterium]